MICRPCATGGRQLQSAREAEGVVREEALRAAKRSHRSCVGGCGCKHVVELDWSKLFSVPNPADAKVETRELAPA